MTGAELKNKAVSERLRSLWGRNSDPWFVDGNKEKRWRRRMVWTSKIEGVLGGGAGQGIWLYSESQQAEKMVDQSPKEPSCPGLEASFSYKTKRGRWGGKVKRMISCYKYFLVLATLPRIRVNFFFPSAIQPWAWSGCLLWAVKATGRARHPLPLPAGLGGSPGEGVYGCGSLWGHESWWQKHRGTFVHLNSCWRSESTWVMSTKTSS